MVAVPVLVALVATASTVSAEALLHAGHMANKRALEARQTGTSGDGNGDGNMADDVPTTCVAPLISAYATLPTPPAELVEYEAEHPATDACSYAVPASLTAALSRYEGQVASWASEREAAVQSVLSQCPELASLASLATDAVVCSTGAGAAAAAVSAAATTTQDHTTVSGITTHHATMVTSLAGAARSQTAAGAGPRETGLVGVIAVAGVVGVLAAL